MPVRRPWAFATAALGSAMLAIYVMTIAAQGDHFSEMLPWALAMAIPASAAVTANFTENVSLARSLYSPPQSYSPFWEP